jgi:hypothetical protein
VVNVDISAQGHFNVNSNKEHQLTEALPTTEAGAWKVYRGIYRTPSTTYKGSDTEFRINFRKGASLRELGYLIPQHLQRSDHTSMEQRRGR